MKRQRSWLDAWGDWTDYNGIGHAESLPDEGQEPLAQIWVRGGKGWELRDILPPAPPERPRMGFRQ